ncbi:MAG: cytochrome d ubiquinol oxidase subunit II [Gemmatimonadaceae bacterium]
MTPSSLLTLPNVVAALVVLSLNAYVLMGGADYGGGVWDLLASGPRRKAQRALVARAIGPIWEANHVWLILVVVLVFTCFPAVFARLMIVLHVPITLMLVGIVARGSAFTFRTYDSQRDAVQRRWGTTFAIASVVTPVLLGVCIGALVSGRVGAADLARGFRAALVDSWLTPFALGVGLFTLVLFAFLAAVYLTNEPDAAADEALREDFRARALASGLTAFVAAGLVLLLAASEAPRLRAVLTQGGWALALHLVTGASAVVALGALWTRRYALARVAAIAQVSCILWGWAWAQYPLIVPPSMTIADAAAPPVTLRLVLLGVAAGFVVLVPSLWYLFRLFKGATTAFERVGEHR